MVFCMMILCTMIMILWPGKHKKRIDPAFIEMRIRRMLRACDLNMKQRVMPSSMHNMQGDPNNPELMYLKDAYFEVKQEFMEREAFEDRFTKPAWERSHPNGGALQGW